MRVVLPVMYLAMAGFLIVGAGIRIAGQLGRGEDVDLLAVVSGGIGLVALVALVLISDSLPLRRPSERDEGGPPSG